MNRIQGLLARRESVVNVLSVQQSVSEAVQTMIQRRVGIVLVASEGRLVGVFSERDAVNRVLGPGLNPATTTLGKVMTPDPKTTHPDDSLRSAVEKMQSANCRHLPVIVEGQIADTISMRDLLFAQLEEQSLTVDEMRSYISGEPAGR